MCACAQNNDGAHDFPSLRATTRPPRRNSAPIPPDSRRKIGFLLRFPAFRAISPKNTHRPPQNATQLKSKSSGHAHPHTERQPYPQFPASPRTAQPLPIAAQKQPQPCTPARRATAAPAISHTSVLSPNRPRRISAPILPDFRRKSRLSLNFPAFRAISPKNAHRPHPNTSQHKIKGYPAVHTCTQSDSRTRNFPYLCAATQPPTARFRPISAENSAFVEIFDFSSNFAEKIALHTLTRPHQNTEQREPEIHLAATMCACAQNNDGVHDFPSPRATTRPPRRISTPIPPDFRRKNGFC